MTARACGSSWSAALSGPGEAAPWLPPRPAHAIPGRAGRARSCLAFLERPGSTSSSRAGPLRSRTGVRSVTTVTYRSPRLVWRHTEGGTSRTGAKRAGESSTPSTSTPSKRSGLPVMVCSARARIALLAVCQEFPQGGCYPGDGHGFQGKGPQSPLHRRVGKPRPGLSQGGGVLPPHPAAVGAGEAPQAYHQLRGPPPHRHMGQAPGHRPTGYSLGPAGSAERVRKPDRHAAIHNRALGCEVLAHSGQSQGAGPRKVVRSGSVKVVSGTSRSLVTVV